MCICASDINWITKRRPARLSTEYFPQLSESLWIRLISTLAPLPLQIAEVETDHLRRVRDHLAKFHKYWSCKRWKRPNNSWYNMRIYRRIRTTSTPKHLHLAMNILKETCDNLITFSQNRMNRLRSHWSEVYSFPSSIRTKKRQIIHSFIYSHVCMKCGYILRKEII